MREFCEAAFPWIVMGIGLAFWAASLKKNSDAKSGDSDEKPNRGTEGMLIGALAGISASLIFEWNLVLGIGLGILAGSCIGTAVKKNG